MSLPDELDPLASLLRRHALGSHYGSRHLGDGHVSESQCSCGTWFPSWSHHRHLAEVLYDAGYSESKR